MNQGFTRRIVGFKDEESEYLLKFLFDHIAKAADYQIRAPYEPGTVVVWVSTLSCLYSFDRLMTFDTNFVGQSRYCTLCHGRLSE